VQKSSRDRLSFHARRRSCGRAPAVCEFGPKVFPDFRRVEIEERAASLKMQNKDFSDCVRNSGSDRRQRGQ
jgi:hypothetical protein